MSTTTCARTVTSFGDLTVHVTDPADPALTVCGLPHSTDLPEGDTRLGWFTPCRTCDPGSPLLDAINARLDEMAETTSDHVMDVVDGHRADLDSRLAAGHSLAPLAEAARLRGSVDLLIYRVCPVG